MFVGGGRPSPAAASSISASSHFQDCCCLSHHSTTEAPDVPTHSYTLSILFSSVSASFWLVVVSHCGRPRSRWNSFQFFHPRSPHAVRPFTPPLSTVLSMTDNIHLIVALIAVSQCHIYGFHHVAHAERTILRRGGRPVALKSAQSSATMSPVVGVVNVVICPTTSYATCGACER